MLLCLQVSLIRLELLVDVVFSVCWQRQIFHQNHGLFSDAYHPERVTVRVAAVDEVRGLGLGLGLRVRVRVRVQMNAAVVNVAVDEVRGLGVGLGLRVRVRVRVQMNVAVVNAADR